MLVRFRIHMQSITKMLKFGSNLKSIWRTGVGFCRVSWIKWKCQTFDRDRVCVCVWEYIHVDHSCLSNIYTVVFKIKVFKEDTKAQNPDFHTHKCTENTAHSIPNQNIKNNVSNVLLYRKWRYRYQVIQKNVWRCITTVSENCFTAVLHGADPLLAPVNRYSSQGRLD